MAIVTIQGNGSRPPLFVFPVADEFPEFVYALAEVLGLDQPVYVLERIRDGENFCADFLEIGRRHAAELDALGLDLPYRFFGFSYGAQSAAITASVIEKAGGRVDFIGIGDDDADVHRRRFDVVGQSLDLTNPVATAFHAADVYVPQKLDGKITLFRSTTWGGSRRPGAVMEWEFLSRGGVDVYPIDGLHTEITRPEKIRAWAPQLAAILAQMNGDASAPDYPFEHVPSRAAEATGAAFDALAAAKRGDLAAEIHCHEAAMAQLHDVPEWISLNFTAALEQSGDLQRAADVAAAAANATPGISNAHVELMRLLKKAGDAERLRQFRGAYEETQSDDPEDWQLQGVFFQEAQAPKRAIESFQHALHLDPLKTDCRLRLTRMLFRLGQTEESMETIEQGLALEPDSAFLQTLVAENFESSGDFPGAERQFRHVIQTHPHHWRAINLLCRLLRRLGREVEAMQLAQDALARQPHHKMLRDFVATSELQ